MSYILVEKLIKGVHDKILLNEVSFAINEGEKVALVGQNGSGKSTLLKIINGKEIIDSGKISKQNDISWSFLEQNPELNLNHTIKEEIFSSDSPTVRAVKLYEESLIDPENIEKMQLAHDAMNKYNAWQYEEKIHEILEKLKLSNLDSKIETLSGGQRKRIALAKILIDTPDFLIMDEPTNHLDLEMIDWLEEYLSNQKITLLLVTHDRYFLDRICNKILELSNGKIYKHNGNYSYYLEQKEVRETNENSNIDKTRAFLKKELQWVRTQPQGRQSKSGARVDAYYKKAENLGQKNVVKAVQMASIDQRMGAKILEIYNLSKSFGDKKILDQFTYSFTKGERIGIIGKNGVGKTTFLNIIMGLENADSGKIVKGETVKFGYYSQHQSELNPIDKVIDSVKKVAFYIKMADGSELTASKLLERFLFSPLDQQKLIGQLSGGEKKRVSLLQILIRNPNFLILDEPTNDFDLMTLDVLAKFLRGFKGCLIVISHDRYFIDSVVDHLFVFKGDGVIKNFPGNYTQYRESIVEEGEKPAQVEEIVEQPVPQKVSPSHEANELYKEINKLEKKKEKLGAKIIELGTDYEEIAKISKQIKEIVDEIEKKTEEWLEM